MKTLTKPQTVVMETLHDVVTHEGGGITLKNRYHSPAHALIRLGYVHKQDRFPYRPHYFITKEGREYWERLLTNHSTRTAESVPPNDDEWNEDEFPFD